MRTYRHHAQNTMAYLEYKSMHQLRASIDMTETELNTLHSTGHLDTCHGSITFAERNETKDINPIHTAMVKARKGHYVHALELSTQYSFECVMEQIAQDFPTATKAELIEFFTTAELHHLVDDEISVLDNEMDEIQLYNTDISDFINEMTEGDFMRTGLQDQNNSTTKVES